MMCKLWIAISVVVFFSNSLERVPSDPKIKVRKDFKVYFDNYQVEGIFIGYDLQNDQWDMYQPQLVDQSLTPASTFKICNSLIGLETGVIKDENFIIPWDGIKRKYEKWNSDHNLKVAFKNSTVWYYQELARRVGKERMQKQMDIIQYGNKKISGGIDQFWLSGDLRITPRQQIEFLKKMYLNQIPVSQRAIDIVKKIMIVEQNDHYILRAKTGWGKQNGKEVGWYVGYVELRNNVYFFATNIQTFKANKDFADSRIEISKQILTQLNILPSA